MKIPNWYIGDNRLFRVKEVIQETKKTFVLRFEGLQGIKQLKKNDRRLRYRKRKPMFSLVAAIVVTLIVVSAALCVILSTLAVA